MSLAAAPSLLRLSPVAAEAERRLLEELAARLRARDDALIERVLRELFPEVRRWMHHHLGSHEELEDAVQDALSEIASALHRFEGRASLATLARRITIRTSYRYYRKAQRPRPMPDADRVTSQDPEARVNARRALERLHVALSRLPERRRSAFVLCAIEGLSAAEAAKILNISRNAMRSLLCRARADLDALLASDDDLGRRR